MTNNVKQIEKVLMKIITMKVDLEKEIENSLKLNQILNRIESRFLIIKKQNANQSTKSEMFASVIKAITKMTKSKNAKKNIVKKTTTTNIITVKKQKLIVKIKNAIEKKELKMIFDVELCKKIKKITKNFKNETIELKYLFNENLIIFLASTTINKKIKK